MARYAEKLHIVPLLAPAASTAGGGVKSYAVRLANSQWTSFLVNWGAMTSDATEMVITVEASTAVGNSTAATDTAIPFVYRLSGVPGTDDNWGNSTTCAETGLGITAAQDNMALLIDVDPASIPALDSDAIAVRLCLDAGDQIDNYATSVTALIEDRYPQAEHISAST